MSDDLVKRLRRWPASVAGDTMGEAADRIEELEAKLAKAVALANTVGTTAADFSALITTDAQAARDRVVAAELEAERDAAYETAVREAAAQAMKWLDDPDDDASLSGYILSLIGDDDE